MKNKEINTQKKALEQRKAENYERYLGPGCYDLTREFDNPQTITKGNPLVSKVSLRVIIRV